MTSPSLEMISSCLAHVTKILEVYDRKRLVLSCEKSHYMVREGVVDGELSRVPSEPRYEQRKRNHSQQQQNTILLLIHEFEKLTIHEMNEKGLSKTLKESVYQKGIIFPPPPFTY